MFIVYILKSKRTSRYYIGCSKNLELRLKFHNQGKVRSTKYYKPWEVVYTESYNTKEKAFTREKVIKFYKGGRAFRKLVNN